MFYKGWRGVGRTRAAVPARLDASNPAHVNNTIYAKSSGFTKGETLVLKMRCGVPPYRKLTLAEAFDKSMIPNA